LEVAGVKDPQVMRAGDRKCNQDIETSLFFKNSRCEEKMFWFTINKEAFQEFRSAI
jgi:hypothetical protein